MSSLRYPQQHPRRQQQQRRAVPSPQPHLKKISQASETNSSLGSGAKAEIGIGAVLGILGLIAIGFLIWRRRHRYNAVHSTSDEAGNDAPEMVTGNWNEGHDLPVVVQDKKGKFSFNNWTSTKVLIEYRAGSYFRRRLTYRWETL